MATSNDKVALTAEEQRLLAALDHRAGRDDPKLHVTLTAGSRAARLRSRRARELGALIVFVAGLALTVSTFATWPLLGVVGVVILAIGAWAGVPLWGQRIATGFQRWKSAHQHSAGGPQRPARP